MMQQAHGDVLALKIVEVACTSGRPEQEQFINWEITLGQSTQKLWPTAPLAPTIATRIILYV